VVTDIVSCALSCDVGIQLTTYPSGLGSSEELENVMKLWNFETIKKVKYKKVFAHERHKNNAYG